MPSLDLVLMIYPIIESSKLPKNIEDGYFDLAWENPKKKYDSVSDSSLVKTERLIRECKLGMDEDFET
jgi:hypothetical protein